MEEFHEDKNNLNSDNQENLFSLNIIDIKKKHLQMMNDFSYTEIDDINEKKLNNFNNYNNLNYVQPQYVNTQNYIPPTNIFNSMNYNFICNPFSFFNNTNFNTQNNYENSYKPYFFSFNNSLFSNIGNNQENVNRDLTKMTRFPIKFLNPLNGSKNIYL